VDFTIGGRFCHAERRECREKVNVWFGKKIKNFKHEGHEEHEETQRQSFKVFPPQTSEVIFRAARRAILFEVGKSAI
jgi:hypothetical protein